VIGHRSEFAYKIKKRTGREREREREGVERRREKGLELAPLEA